PTGLIRYASLKGIQEKIPFRFTPRMLGYSVVLVLLLSLVTILFSIRKAIEVTILRTPGMLYQQIDAHTIGNLYNVEFVNKTFQDMPLELKLKNSPGRIKWVGSHQSLSVPGQEIVKAAFFIELPKQHIQTNNTKLIVEVYAHGKLISEEETSFLGPAE
ncbi:MAG TPA: FixG Ig-like domain-containing protein, partial [Flavisolibacter sp.]|nr:FixG Ig-like domain-containing protein [Flavisolibacter sp.]